MIRRWSIPLFALAATLGSVMAAGTASATPAAAHATPRVTNLTEVQPGGAMLAGGQAAAHAAPAAHAAAGAKTTDESTNWSGYALSGSNGQFTSVSASWKQPAATCSSRRNETFSSF